MRLYHLLAFIAGAALWATPSAAQQAPGPITYTNLPTICDTNRTRCVTSIPVVGPDGQPGGGTPTSAAGTPNANVVTVQGTDAGTPQNVTQRGTAGLATAQVSVGTTATLVAAARATRARLTVTQNAAGPCYYGSSAAVSATTGARLKVDGATKTYQYRGDLYGICPGGAVTIDTDEEF